MKNTQQTKLEENPKKIKLDPDCYVRLLNLFSNPVWQWNILIQGHQYPLVILFIQHHFIGKQA